MYNTTSAQAITLILLTNIIFFVVDLLNRKNSIETNTLNYIFNRSIYTSIFASFWCFLSFENLYYNYVYDLVQISAFSIICGLGFYFFILSNKYLQFTNILFIQLVGHVLHQVFGLLIFDESLSKYYIFTTILLIIGIGIQSTIPNQKKGLILALLSTISWTIGYSYMSVPLKNVSTPLSVLILEFTLLIFYYILVAFYSKNIQPIILYKKRGVLLFIAILTIFGSFLLNYTYKNYFISQIGYLNLIIMPIFIFVSLRINKEKLSKKEIISNAFILIAYAISLL